MTSQAAIIAAPARPAPWRVARDLLVLSTYYAAQALMVAGLLPVARPQGA